MLDQLIYGDRESEIRYRGVVYDVGLRFQPDVLSVEPWDVALVAHDMGVIANDLHANAVRIEGERIDRLVEAATVAHKAGLAVFFNPWKMNAGVEETETYLAEAASAAETLRGDGVEIVFVATCEFTIFCDGIFPGSTVMERISWLGSQMVAEGSEAPMPRAGVLADKAVALNSALRSFVEVIRATFQGPVTYSAGAWEDVDWTLFDIVGVDYYRNGESHDDYVGGLHGFRRNGKALAVMEFGCCAYEGAASRGGAGFMVLRGVNEDGSGDFEGGSVPIRSEREQAAYVKQQLDVFADEGVDAAFVYVFSFPSYRFGDGARDFDMVSYSLVKTFPESDPRSQLMPPWEPKEAFHAVAEHFGKHAG